jgi:uncharacterized membrane protein YgcG
LEAVFPVEAAALVAAAQEGAGRMKPKEFFNKLEHDAIISAIRDAESKICGEIRVFISHKHRKDPLAAGQRRFLKLRMDKTKEHNAVLIYLAPRSHTFAIVGDTAVHSRCGDDFWKEVTQQMSVHFRKGEFTQGIIHGIQRAGKLLAQHFPRHSNDMNQLPDEIEHD